MKAYQQKSGRWQARYIDHYEVVDGKKKAVKGCVTADTEREAIREAIKREGSGKLSGSDILVSFAIAKYIEAKKAVLSPSTLRAYKALQKNAYEAINALTLSEATGATLQLWVSKYATTHSPKATRNAYALLASSVRMFERDADMTVTLPQKKQPDLYTPTDEDIKKLLAAVKGTDMEKAVLLAAFGTLRRGEVCALTYDDIKGNTITVSKSMAEKDGGGTALKAPKTPQSVRTITLPPEVIKTLMEGTESGKQVVSLTPTAISNAFPDALKKAGLPRFRFHDLRAYSASIRHAIGIPDQYIMKEGGWKSDSVLKAIYRRTMADKEETFESKINAHFTEMLK